MSTSVAVARYIAFCILFARNSWQPCCHMLGGTDLRSLSRQPDTGLHCQTADTELVHRAVCLLTPQLLLVFIAPTTRRDGQAELTCRRQQRFVSVYIKVH